MSNKWLVRQHEQAFQKKGRENMSTAKPIPEGFHTITPHIVVRDANGAIDFYKRAFGADELSRMPGPDGKSIMHATIKIGDSIVMLADEFPGTDCASPTSVSGTSVTLHLYVDDVDALAERAIHAGATVRMPVSDMFWGDRYGVLADPFGHRWSISTHKQDLTADEMRKGAEKAFPARA
jgi:PhnB protein